MARISVENLSRYFGTSPALRGVSVEIESGEVVALTGSNGAGKSTFLHCLAGVQIPDSGRVLVEDWDLSKAEQYASARGELNFGVLLQDSMLYAELTVAENLELMLGLSDIVPFRPSADELVAEFGLQAVLDKKARDCSQGMLRRAALARALGCNPDLALLDEPFAHLDKNGEQQLYDVLVQKKTAGVTMVIATHNHAVVENLASRVLHFESGSLFEDISGGRA